ncbi:hypothetical protein OPV22_030742 [Ensete ventricosum]|uniref:Protein kish n=1 Tax=Ensete ventricosum TaxID=4639 RepID=A0AAV8PJS4_ENSVE|nr:hypothetical protein OPV22_030742 [Ensete ventricosum]
MSALFNFHSFLTVVLLVICTCTYIKMQFPAILERKTGFRGFFWKAARIGERLSPWVAFGCFAMVNFISFGHHDKLSRGICNWHPIIFSSKLSRGDDAASDHLFL